jgi:hypothetical protein
LHLFKTNSKEDVMAEVYSHKRSMGGTMWGLIIVAIIVAVILIALAR